MITGESIQEYARAFVRPRYPWLIDPRVSKRVGYWDALTAMALIFTATITPYEVGFLPTADSLLNPLFLLNRVVDVIFILDMLIQFFTMYSHEVTTRGTPQSLTQCPASLCTECTVH